MRRQRPLLRVRMHRCGLWAATTPFRFGGFVIVVVITVLDDGIVVFAVYSL